MVRRETILNIGAEIFRREIEIFRDLARKPDAVSVEFQSARARCPPFQGLNAKRAEIGADVQNGLAFNRR